jgi:hypothetical protein
MSVYSDPTHRNYVPRASAPTVSAGGRLFSRPDKDQYGIDQVQKIIQFAPVLNGVAAAPQIESTASIRARNIAAAMSASRAPPPATPATPASPAPAVAIAEPPRVGA